MKNPKKLIAVDHGEKEEKSLVHFVNSGNWIELTGNHFFPYG
jgi:hypothetical protein